MPFPSLCFEEVYFLVLEREHCEEGDFPEADPPSIHSTQECISILSTQVYSLNAGIQVRSVNNPITNLISVEGATCTTNKQHECSKTSSRWIQRILSGHIKRWRCLLTRAFNAKDKHCSWESLFCQKGRNLREEMSVNSNQSWCMVSRSFISNQGQC